MQYLGQSAIGATMGYHIIYMEMNMNLLDKFGLRSFKQSKWNKYA